MMFAKGLRPILKLAAAILLASAGLLAQENRGTISGIVTDSSGAPVPSATVHVREVNTGIVNTTQADASGNFTVPFLPPGTYQVSVQATGFATSVNPSVVLNAQETHRVDFSLSIGSVKQEISVTSESPLLQTSTAATQGTVATGVITQLPLQNLNAMETVTLLPGISNTTNSVLASVEGRQGGISPSANGARDTASLYTADGANITVGMYNISSFNPVEDAVQEVAIQTGNYSAQYGQGTGAHINFVLKSGTNKIHGDVFEFLENDDLNGRNFFSSTTSPLKQNQFGGLVGGPIIKNRTFFFGAYSGTRLATASPLTGTVLTAAQRTGNLSENTVGAPVAPITNPATGQPFPGNQVPIGATAAAALQYLEPLPNKSGAINWEANLPQPTTYNSYLGKIDHNFSDRDSLSGRVWISRTNQLSQGNNGAIGIFHTYSVDVNSYNGALIETHTFSPTAVLASRVSWNRNVVVENWPENPSNLDTRSVFGMVIPSTISPSDPLNSYPQFAVSGLSNIGESGNVPLNQPDENYEIADTLALIKGKHSLNVGYELDRYRSARFVNNTINGSLSFQTTNPAGTGNAIADFFLGLPSTSSIGINPDTFDFRHTAANFFIADNWRVTRKLTLNYGIRYELYTPVNEHWGRVPIFDFTAPGAFLDLNPGQPLYSNSYRNWAPRLGVVYQITNHDVIRSAGGVYYSQPYLLGLLSVSADPPFAETFTFNAAAGAPLQSSNPFPVGQAVTGGVVSPQAVQFKQAQPAFDAWTFDYQHSFSSTTLLDVAYVANHGVHFGRNMSLNVPLVPEAGAIQARRPLPNWGAVTYLQFDSKSSYEGLQVKLEKQFSHGLTVLGSYTRSKELDMSPDDQNGGTIDPNHLDRDYGPDLDVPSNLKVSYIYAIPVGRGREFLGSSGRLTDAILGGWQLTGVTTYQSGLPFTVVGSGSANNVGLTDRPNRVCNGRLSDRTLLEWFNPSCFMAPAKYTFGDSGFGILRYPSQADWDIGVMKNFHTFEKQYLQFRAEAYNAFNKPNFTAVSATVGTPSIGQVTAALPGRIMAFALKYYF